MEGTKGKPWFAAERKGALADFLAVYLANIDPSELIRFAMNEPDLVRVGEVLGVVLAKMDKKAMRERLRRAMEHDEWAELEEQLRAFGAFAGEHGFSEWQSFPTLYVRLLALPLAQAYAAEPARLAAAMTVLVEYFARVAETVSEARYASSEASNRALFEASPLPMMVFADDTLAFVAVNDAAVELYGWSREELLRMSLRDLKPPVDDATLPTILAADRTTAHRWQGNRHHMRKDGTIIEVEINATPILVEGKKCRLTVEVDVTEKRRLEAQLRHSQKMEAVGTLAGGVAHDFNNMLGVILSGADGLLARARDPQDREELLDVKAAAERSAVLTRQLLAFSRRQVMRPIVIDLNARLREFQKMLARVISEDVELALHVAPDLWRIKADIGQIEQVVMNLAVNARDAMPTGGTLTIATSNVTLGADDARLVDLEPGPYVRLEVTDTGTGFDAATRLHIFEPFFTTKEPGKGTGLGLSTAYGIVRQSGGHIDATSTSGGATFTILLPRTEDEDEDDETAIAPPSKDSNERRPKQIRTILLVEDEQIVRHIARRILERARYRVIEAASGTDALRICEDRVTAIDLLFTDVVMPGMSGATLAERVREMLPDTKVLYTSGHTEDAIHRHGVVAGGQTFIAKPFTARALAAKVREVLEG